MEVSESTLKRLIEGQKQFQIPLYQRRFTWRDTEISQLWADVLEQYDLLTPDEDGQVPHSPPTHFLGSMVLAPSRKDAAGLSTFLVIDGQQRLTTLLIALCALRDHAEASDPNVVERFDEIYLLNKFESGLDHYRLLPTQSDRPAFFACVKPDPSRRTGGIGLAYSFFRSRLAKSGPDNQPLDVARLEEVLRQRLQFVAITAGPNDNVHRIFESLNDRGVQLTQADLLRNYVFMLLPTRADHVYQTVWRPMQDSLTSSQLETLVFVDLILRGNTTIKRPDIYREQQNRLKVLEGDEEAVEAEIMELARRGRLFLRVVQPENEPDLRVRATLEHLDRWAASTTYPVLLHLYDSWDQGTCSGDDVAEALSYVESFLVRRMIAGVATNNLYRIFSSLVPQIPADLPIAEGVRHALSGTRKYWPSDRRLREAIRSQPFYFQGRQDQKMLVFERLEASYEHAEPIDWRASKLSIEHVMPQTLSDEWREGVAIGGEDPDAVHEQLLHTLGNLTVTAYNGQLSNSPIGRKQDILRGSHLELNRSIALAEHWGRNEILARAEELADRAIRLWPAPMQGVEEPAETRDWSRLHAALAALPYGAWTTYGDAAALVGSHHVAVGQHLASTTGIPNAHRVLNAEGRVADVFRWSDPTEARDVMDVLRNEGVRFDADGRARQTGRLHPEDLARLIGEEVELRAAAEPRDHEWAMQRYLRYLRHFYNAPQGRLHQDDALALAVEEGYDTRGLGGFYQATARLRKDGQFRVLTESGRQFFENNQYRLARTGAASSSLSDSERIETAAIAIASE